MYRFIRTATVKHPAPVYTALEFASEVCAHINKQYALGLRALSGKVYAVFRPESATE